MVTEPGRLKMDESNKGQANQCGINLCKTGDYGFLVTATKRAAGTESSIFGGQTPWSGPEGKIATRARARLGVRHRDNPRSHSVIQKP